MEDVVDAILADVRTRGDEALKEYALKFDGANLENLQVTQEEIEDAFSNMDPYFLETLKEAAANIESFHRQQVHKNFVVNDKPGIVLGQKSPPIEKAGIYVPGGTAAYPSTVLMDVIPAKVAGVSEIVMTTPAGKDGKVNPVILAAAATAGVTKIFKTGGAQAVAALAYGTRTIPAVDKIVGPGNIYVATAKRKVFGKVGIDMIAGPSEILVLADGGCNPAWVAADLLSQAEHDKLASPVLVTDSPALARAVQAELEVQIPQLPRAAIARASVDDNGKIIVCTDLHKAIEACNIIAPEHLEVCVEDPFGVLNEIKNAGSIFLGRNVPEALGDYFAGPNHTLPTSGTARFSSPWAWTISSRNPAFSTTPGRRWARLPPHCRFCRAGGPARPRPQCDDSIREIKGGLPSQAASRPAVPLLALPFSPDRGKSFPKGSQDLSLWERWHRVSDDGEG